MVGEDGLNNVYLFHVAVKVHLKKSLFLLSSLNATIFSQDRDGLKWTVNSHDAGDFFSGMYFSRSSSQHLVNSWCLHLSVTSYSPSLEEENLGHFRETSVVLHRPNKCAHFSTWRRQVSDIQYRYNGSLLIDISPFTIYPHSRMYRRNPSN